MRSGDLLFYTTAINLYEITIFKIRRFKRFRSAASVNNNNNNNTKFISRHNAVRRLQRR